MQSRKRHLHIKTGIKTQQNTAASGKSAKIRSSITWAVQITIVAAAAWVLAFCFCQRCAMTGNAMNPTLDDGEVVLLNLPAVHVASPDRGDIVAFYPNGNTKSHLYLRRVVGIPGDTIQIQDGKLYVNGEAQTLAGQEGDITSAGLAEEELTLRRGEYFVIGDNPNESEDSRSNNIGTVTQEDMAGKAWFIFSPRAKSGLI